MALVLTYAILAAIYFIPTFISLFRGSQDVFYVFMMNAFFGWSVIGWIMAFLMAVLDESV